MREAFARCAVVLGVGLAAMTVQGCKKKAAPAPVQPAVRSVPQVKRDSPLGSLQVEHVDTDASRRADQTRQRRIEAQPEVEDSGAQAEAAAAAQRQQDALLLQQQQEASQKQQQELDQEIQQTVKRLQEVQGEPRITDAPPGPGVGPGQPTAPMQPTQPQF